MTPSNRYASLSPLAQLEQLIESARANGFEIRYEQLGGTGGGVCEFRGKRWLFVDLSVSTIDALERLTDALRPFFAETVSKPSAAA